MYGDGDRVVLGGCQGQLNLEPEGTMKGIKSRRDSSGAGGMGQAVRCGQEGLKHWDMDRLRCSAREGGQQSGGDPDVPCITPTVPWRWSPSRPLPPLSRLAGFSSQQVSWPDTWP